MAQQDIPGLVVDEMFQSGAPTNMPWYLDMAETMPTIGESLGFSMHRGSNTIIGGGWRDRRGRINTSRRRNFRSTAFREGIAQNMPRPRNAMRYGSASVFHHRGAAGFGAGANYTPFNMSGATNVVGRALAGTGKNNWATRQIGRLNRGEPGRHAWMLKQDGQLASRGFMSRVTAAGKVGMMSEARFQNSLPTMTQFLDDAGSLRAGSGPLSRTTVRQGLMMSGGGTLTGFAGGFAGRTQGAIDPALKMTAANKRGARVAGQWMTKDFGLKAGEKMTVGAARSGIKAGVGMAVKSKLLTKGAALMVGSLATGPAAPFVAIAGTLLTIAAVAEMAVKLPGYAAQTATDAYKSFQGGMRVGIMEQGFRDTEATMTSRSRGVSAIQNSRLNARSILGSESSAMAAHFG